MQAIANVLIALVADSPGSPVASSDGRATDFELIHRLAQQGDRPAFGELYDRYGTPAYSLARRICVDPELAEDVVQEAFLALWRHPARFDPARGSFGTWLMTLVHHRAVDAVRKENTQRRRAVPLADDVLPPVEGSDHAALVSVVSAEVRAALRTLPEEQRRAIALAYLGGYTQCEVAKLTGVPLGTVKSRTFTAIRRLKGKLGNLWLGETGEMIGVPR